MAERLDAYLVRTGLAKSRERAKAMIKNSSVTVNGRICDKPSQTVEESDTVEAGSDLAYVGRGALKLEKAFEVFKPEVAGLVCADLGASTGGFTELLLDRGASKVYAVDVGHGQLDEKLCRDSRVVNMEGTNVRRLDASSFGEDIGFVTADLSFISLTVVMPVISGILCPGGRAVVLIKPQFEAGRENIGKNGIVKDRKVHIEVLRKLTAAFGECGLSLRGLTHSPVKGGSGNTEYLAYLIKSEDPPVCIDVKAVVEAAFSDLKE
ncbi:MAG: TlyA family RNA methyltransferase [Ruminococcus sp.]|nr:TlyA family RNA methyltransferase [Ruminococcus sp.]